MCKIFFRFFFLFQKSHSDLLMKIFNHPILLINIVCFGNNKSFLKRNFVKSKLSAFICCKKISYKKTLENFNLRDYFICKNGTQFL